MPLKLKKRGDVWHYSGTVAGERVRRSAKTTQKDEALIEANRHESRILNRDRDGAAATLTFAEAAIEYRKVKGEKRYLELVEDHWKDMPVKQITGGVIKQAAIALLPGGSAAYRNRAVIVPTTAVINYCADLDLCPPVKAKRFTEVRRKKEPATVEWIEAFMVHASPHLGALACFMFATGARISEALAVTWGDVDLGSAEVVIRMSKTGGERTANLPPRLIAAIANIVSDRQPGNQVFPYASYRACSDPWEVAIRRAGIRRLTPHSCRHGFATSMLHAGYDPVTVAEHGGWASPQHIFKTYGHAIKDKTVNNVLFGNLPASPTKDRRKALKQ